MNGLLAFFKRMQIGSILTIFIAGIALFLTTAYSSGNLEGTGSNNLLANNLLVQVGDNSNLQRQEGNEYINYKMSADSSVSRQSSTVTGSYVSLIDFGQLIAANAAVNVAGKNPNGIIYSAPDTHERSGIGQVDPKVFERDAQSIPAQRQPVIDRSDADLNILEKIGDAFAEGSSFLKGDVDQAAKAALENAERKGER